mmetsp:Transcript_106326/g.297638  ORF Transcript_106326/g.297638 Transcript_106326/m.297638 type:complete len:262 (-) Transcript_106326:2-787(-)
MPVGQIEVVRQLDDLGLHAGRRRLLLLVLERALEGDVRAHVRVLVESHHPLHLLHAPHAWQRRHSCGHDRWPRQHAARRPHARQPHARRPHAGGAHARRAHARRAEAGRREHHAAAWWARRRRRHGRAAAHLVLLLKLADLLLDLVGQHHLELPAVLVAVGCGGLRSVVQLLHVPAQVLELLRHGRREAKRRARPPVSAAATTAAAAGWWRHSCARRPRRQRRPHREHPRRCQRPGGQRARQHVLACLRGASKPTPGARRA